MLNKSLYITWCPKTGMQFRIGPPGNLTMHSMFLIFYRIDGMSMFHVLKNKFGGNSYEVSFDEILKIVDRTSVRVLSDRNRSSEVADKAVENILNMYTKREKHG